MSRIFVRGEKKENVDPSQSPRPKLARRNAAKNFEYIPSPLPSPSTSSRRSGFGRQARSLDIPHSGSRNSFRLDGSDGELDMVYRSLGLSGPDDFEIPRDMWELMKSRSSSDVIKRPDLSFFESEDPEEPWVQNVDAIGDELSDGFNDRVQINESTMPPNQSSGTAPCNGIRGDCPPLLTPPPAMSLPVLDNGCSTWDLINSLAPDDEESILGGTPMIHFSDHDDAEADAAGDNVERDRVNGVRLGETLVLSGSSSFTSHDDDASSSTTDPVSVISPNGAVRANITYWEKGDLLGQGSFGKVYKAISSEGFFFAVKEVSLTEQGTQGRQSVLQLEQEIDLLSQFEHKNIVRYLGTAKDDSTLYIFLELVTQGSLVSLYQRYNLRDSQVSVYTRQILYGLQYLHDRRVVH
ncbi:Mitogen-activated protein kinase kinase kinase 1-like protein [Drosera capensis]